MVSVFFWVLIVLLSAPALPNRNMCLASGAHRQSHRRESLLSIVALSLLSTVAAVAAAACFALLAGLPLPVTLQWIGLGV